jgi:hypothetical protein
MIDRLITKHTELSRYRLKGWALTQLIQHYAFTVKACCFLSRFRDILNFLKKTLSVMIVFLFSRGVN